MKNLIKIYLICAFICSFLAAGAQVRKGINGIPELKMTSIKGAPVLGKPTLIISAKGPLMSHGHGLAAPAYYDMNEDGLKDLLIGEFGSGLEFGSSMGNFIRVYENEGSGAKPMYTGRFSYARPPFEYQVEANGTPYSVDQFCCIGFTPQFIDLDQDGFLDMISGTYQGEVFWFRGSKIGFHSGKPLPQEGDPRGKDWVRNQSYWLFSSASFGDFTGDGLADLITGGKSLRISKNIGTKENPSFAKRELLLDLEGNPLRVFTYSAQDSAYWKRMQNPVPTSGDIDLSPLVFDWDNDGVLDLLVTNSYSHAGLEVVNFFKGIKQGNIIRFAKGVALFEAKDGSKAFPGSCPRVFVTDYNDDGVNDLLIGASVATTKGKFNDQLSWNWEKDEGILAAGKDPANLNEDSLTPDQFKRWRDYTLAKKELPKGMSFEEFHTIRHQGYVFVMLGRK